MILRLLSPMNILDLSGMKVGFILFSLIGLNVCTLKDNHNIVYVLPRPGIRDYEDCYVNMYADDIIRDIEIIDSLGVTTVVTLNPWNFNTDHNVFLTSLNKYNISLGITFHADFEGIARRNLEKLKKQLIKFNVTLEFILLDYPLDFDNAEDFFKWTSQVKGWMLQQEISVPLIARFYPEVKDDITIDNLLQRWDSSDFDAWLVEHFSVAGVEDWLVEKMKCYQKKVFFYYGSDKWTTLTREVNYEDQSKQLEELVQFTGGTHPKSPISNYSQLLGSALLSYSDILYLGRRATYYLGGKGDICPDNNPYLQTSCGGVDQNILYGDTFYSIERMGIFDQYETIMYFRCIKPGLAAITLKNLWGNSKKDGPSLDKDICVFSVSTPGMYILFLWAAGLVMALLGVIAGTCKGCQRDRIRKKKEFKRDDIEEILIEESQKLTKKKSKKEKKGKKEKKKKVKGNQTEDVVHDSEALSSTVNTTT